MPKNEEKDVILVSCSGLEFIKRSHSKYQKKKSEGPSKKFFKVAQLSITDYKESITSSECFNNQKQQGNRITQQLK